MPVAEAEQRPPPSRMPALPLPQPVVIFALPRSRTAWLRDFLCGGGAPRLMLHDLDVQADSVDDFVAVLGSGKVAGTVETGAMRTWRTIRKRLPEVRFLVVRRHPDDVERSMAACGLPSNHDEIAERVGWLDEIAAQYGTTSIDVSRLDDPAYCGRLWTWCHGVPCLPSWPLSQVQVNVQIDIPERLRLLVEWNRTIEAMKADADSADARLRGVSLPFVQFKLEPWPDVEAEAVPLGEAHFNEVEHLVEPRRPYRLDCEAMRARDATGAQLFFTARVDGELVGYCMWTTMSDVESAGLPVAYQGPWFAVDRNDLRGLRLGLKLFDRTLEHLRERGIQCVFPHHRLQGRGADLDAFFRRKGAKEIQREYCLWIGED